MLDDFCAFILTHGRPDRVYTFDQLSKAGYTGKTYIVCDDEDKTIPQYRERFGDRVLTFSKAQIAETFDEGDNFAGRRGVVYARNACFDIARQVGVTYFIVLDDDYTDFRYKFDESGNYVPRRQIRNLDAVFAALLDFYKSTPALSIAFAQGGDFIGGRESGYAEIISLKRKVMNTFFCSTERRFDFVGRINEDTNAYVAHGNRGGLFLTIPNIAIQQVQTQANPGGLTGLYLDAGTYVKSFYSVMYCPSSVKVAEMGRNDRRLHHRVKWAATVPVILDERHRKPRTIPT